MLTQFIQHIKNTKLFEPTHKIILAISGGKDSIAMLDLFVKANFNIVVAHCNFKLRGKESNLDQLFVEKIAQELDVLFYTTSFNTEKYAKSNKVSIQMAARELRYQWFYELKKEINADYIATAHHKNDIAETVLINLTKGAGLAGLHGILEKKNSIIRPMLIFNVHQITNYIKKNKLNFREDTSNASTKYTRNAIRHKVIPELEQINPKVIDTISNTANRISEIEKVLHEKIEEEMKHCIRNNQNQLCISIDAINKLTHLNVYLYYFLEKYGFNATDIDNIINTLPEQSGKQFFSKTHSLTKDRNELILTTTTSNQDNTKTANNIKELANNFNFDVKLITQNQLKNINKSPQYAYLDFDKISFPLTLRNWENGDVFKPFGMKGKKKVSDFFVDQKFSIPKKENTQILTNSNEIVWIVGHRIDDNYKITNSTKNILILKTS